MLLALPGLATLAVSVPAGVAADRLGARRCTLLAGVVLCVSCLAQAAPSLPSLLVGRLLFGVAYGVLWTTGVAWLAELDTEPGGSRIGPSVTCASVGMMVGPAVGGLVAGGRRDRTAVPADRDRVRGRDGAVDDRRGACGRDGARIRVGRRRRDGDEAAELARAVGYSESVELASSLGYGEPVPYGGAETSPIRARPATTGRGRGDGRAGRVGRGRRASASC